MSQDIPLPEAFQEWKRRAETSEQFGAEWGDYHRLMLTYVEALQRAPRTPEACDQTQIDDLLIAELEHLAKTIHAIFPSSILEFAEYLTEARDQTEEPDRPDDREGEDV
jgi:hypothetical protein